MIRVKVVFPVTLITGKRLTLDGKQKILTDASRYSKYIEKAEDLSAEEIMYLVKRTNELEDTMNKIKMLSSDIYETV